MAALAWLITAALTGYLAYEQWSLSQAVISLGVNDEGLAGYAAWNAITAAITLFFGARLLTTPSRKLLDRSAAWAALSVLGGVAQIALSAGSGLFALVTIGSAVAGVLSYVARQAIAEEPTTAPSSSSVVSGWQAASPSAVTAQVSPAVTAAQQPPRSGGLGMAEKLVIALIVLAVLGGGAILYTRMQVEQTLSDVAPFLPTATSRPTSRPARTVAPDEYIAQLGEAVPLVDLDNNNPLGSVTVIKNGKPSELLGSGPTAGYRYIAALVRYEADATWSYNLYDWAAHDATGTLYNPLFYAPNPSLSYGDLPAGRNVEAWVAFEVPSGVRDVWLDYGGAPVIFSVKID